MAAKAPASSREQLRAARAWQPGDPEPRQDGTCLSCGGDRPAIAQACGDAFCSSTCAREHYGTQLPVVVPGVGRV